MFDTMTLTKVVLGFCGTFLVFLLGGWAAEIIYHTGGGHGKGEEHAQGYLIEVAEAEPAEEEVEVPFAEVYAAADSGKGQSVFGKCRACHKLEDGANAVGPHLFGVVDRPVEAADGFGYSGSIAAVAETWDVESLNAFLENPRSFAPGTSMSFSGLPKVEDRANLIAYLATIGG